jgi:hypothetical protein
MKRWMWLIIGGIGAVLAAGLSVGWAFAQSPQNPTDADTTTVAPYGQAGQWQNDQAMQGQNQGRRGPPADRRPGDGNRDNMVDEDGDGVCDNAGQSQGRRGPPADRQPGDGNRDNMVDEDGDGVCDNMIDEDGDGVCDNIGSGRGQGRGQGQGQGRNQP